MVQVRENRVKITSYPLPLLLHITFRCYDNTCVLKYEPFSHICLWIAKMLFLGKHFFLALGHSRNSPYPLHGENWKDPLFSHPTDISPPPKAHLGIKSSSFKFTNILLHKSIHTSKWSNNSSLLQSVNPSSNLHLQATPPFGHLKIFLSPP